MQLQSWYIINLYCCTSLWLACKTLKFLMWCLISLNLKLFVCLCFLIYSITSCAERNEVDLFGVTELLKILSREGFCKSRFELQQDVCLHNYLFQELSYKCLYCSSLHALENDTCTLKYLQTNFMLSTCILSTHYR